MSYSSSSDLSALVWSVVSPRTEQDRKRRRIFVLCIPFFILAVVAAFFPLSVMIRMSVSADRFQNVGFTLEAWRALVENPVYLRVAWNTLWFAAVTSLTSVAIGVAVAHVVQKYTFPFKSLVVSMISFPIALPGIVVAFMIVVLLGRQGLLTNLAAFFTGQSAISLATATGVFGLYLGYVYSLIPRATMVLQGTYAEVNTDAEEAARSLGASPLLTFYYITMPEIRPGVVAAIILTFRTALAIFGTVLVLQGLNVVTLRLNHEIQVGFNSQIAAAIGILYFVFILGFTFVGLKYTSTDVIEI